MKMMSGLDARFLFSETKSTPMHTIKVAIVDVSGRSHPLTPDRLRAILESRLERMPVLRQRIIKIPLGLANPVVIDDPDFDLERHIHWRTLNAPGGSRELDALIARVLTTRLPRDRPLWELNVVEGLEQGRVAFVVKIHHALADGVAAVALLVNAFLAEDDGAVLDNFEPEPVPASRALYRTAAKATSVVVGSIPRFTRYTVTGLRLRRLTRKSEDTPVLGPFAGPRTPFNVSLVPDRTFATLTLDMDTLRAARTKTGASTNDVFLAICAGGIRRYLLRMDQLPETSLVASVPVATKTEQHRLAGNHVDNLFLPIHTDEVDPIQRTRRIHASASAARRDRHALGPELFEFRAGLIPPALYAATMKSWAATKLSNRVRPPLNLIASSVPGPRAKLEMEGGAITALYSCGPILEGIGLNITAWSYIDTMFVSMLGCSRTLPDPWVLADDIAEEMSVLTNALHGH